MNIENPFFSIVIPSYNRAPLIGATIRSVLNQTLKNWELIIVDDGSTDNTKEIVFSFHDDRIKYIYQDNAERSAARNNGIKHALGEWICFLDSDDEYLPGHLESIYKTLELDNSVALLTTGIIRNQNGTHFEIPLLDLTAPNLLKEIWTKFLIPTQVCINKIALQEDVFEPQYRIWEDTHLFLRIAAKHPIRVVPVYSCMQNVHEQGTVVIGLKKVRMTDVNQYIHAIQSLKQNKDVLQLLTVADINAYIDSKYRMYLYQARQNRQFAVSIKIWYKAFLHRPSIYLVTEFPKIILNKFGFGLQDV